jgi:hypothetical protein
MAQHRTLAAGEDRGEPSASLVELSVPDCVDSSVDAM